LGWGLIDVTFSCGCCGKSANGEESYRQALDESVAHVELHKMSGSFLKSERVALKTGSYARGR
jgi:hypothetical protein